MAKRGKTTSKTASKANGTAAKAEAAAAPSAPSAPLKRKRGLKAKPKASPAPAHESSSRPPMAAGMDVIDEVDAIEIDISSFLEEGDSRPNRAPPATITAPGARRAERVNLDENVQLRGFFGDDVVGAGAREDRVLDASIHGVFVETAQVLDPGDPVVLSFTLEDGKKLSVSGRVRWVTPFGGLRDARPGMGIELVGLAGEAREALAAHLTRKQKAQLLA